MVLLGQTDFCEMLDKNNDFKNQHISTLMSVYSGHILPSCRIYSTEGNIKTGEKTMDALLKLRDLLEIMKISRSTLWRVQQQEDFPKPVALLGRKRWRREELQAWLDAQAALRSIF
jgi:predicted DNA-binding transcriptional regulator AlpA